MTVPAASAAVRMAWAGPSPARRAVRPAVNATFGAPDRASSKVRTRNSKIKTPDPVPIGRADLGEPATGRRICK